MPKLSLQLWSLKEETQKDFRGTLKKVAELGYDGVEFAGFGDIEAAEMKELLSKYNLEVSGAHIGLDALESNLDELIEYNRIIGNKYIICPSSDVKSAEDCMKMHERMCKISEKLKDYGMVMGFHNHAREFVKYDGRYANDLLVGTDEKLIYEIDVYWTTYAEVDTVEYIKKIGKRCPLLHLKDMRIDKDGSKKDITFGEGVVERDRIIAAAMECCNPEWFVIEWEAFGEMDAIEAVGAGLKNLKVILDKMNIPHN